MIGVENRPPRLPIEVMVKVPPRRSSSFDLPVRASLLSRAASWAISSRLELIRLVNHRHDQSAGRGHRHAEVVLIVQGDLAGLLVQRAVDDRHFLESADHGLDEERNVRELESLVRQAVPQRFAHLEQFGDVAFIDVGGVSIVRLARLMCSAILRRNPWNFCLVPGLP